MCTTTGLHYTLAGENLGDITTMNFFYHEHAIYRLFQLVNVHWGTKRCAKKMALPYFKL